MNQPLLERATAAYIGVRRWQAMQKHRTGSKNRYDGPVADRVLASGGVTWSRDRHEYLMYERAMRERANEAEPPPRPGQRRPYLVCAECGKRRYRKEESGASWRAARFCSRRCAGESFWNTEAA